MLVCLWRWYSRWRGYTYNKNMYGIYILHLVFNINSHWNFRGRWCIFIVCNKICIAVLCYWMNGMNRLWKIKWLDTFYSIFFLSKWDGCLLILVLWKWFINYVWDASVSILYVSRIWNLFLIAIYLRRVWVFMKVLCLGLNNF